MPLPGGQGPQDPLKFVVKKGPFADGQTVPVCSYVTNANAPAVADYAFLAGTALIIASAMNPQGPSYSAEYQFGTHAVQLYNAEAAKTQIRPSVRTPALLTGNLGAYVSVPQQPTDSQQAILSRPLIIGQGVVRPPVWAQDNPAQFPAAQVWSSVRATTATTGILGKYVSVGQLETDNSIAAWSIEAAPLAVGPVPAYTTALQFDPVPLQAQIQQSLRTPPVTSGFLGKYVSIQPQQPDTYQPSLSRPLIIGQGPVPPSIWTSQDNQTQFATNSWAQVWKSAATPPVIVNGPTVWPNATVQPQWDFSVNPSVLWTPSTFSPSSTPDQGAGIPAGDGGKNPNRGFNLADWKKKHKPLKDLEDDIERLYKEITSPPLVRQAEKVVKPFVPPKLRDDIKPSNVEWDKVVQSIRAIEKLHALYEQEIRDDDDDIEDLLTLL